jgi:taurine dioxygenase
MAASGALSSSPLHPFTGVQVDVDLREELSPQQREQLVDLYNKHHLLLFRGTPLTMEEQTRAIGYFGESVGGSYISNTVPGAGAPEGELEFHSDLTYTPLPTRGISLYAEDVEPGCAGTKYANAQRAYSLLPGALRDKLRDRKAMHLRMPDHLTSRTREEHMGVNGVRATQPVIYPKPETGEPVLLITKLAVDRILDLPEPESEAILEECYGYLYAPENVYEHQWQQHDLLIWDNLALQHARSHVEKDGPHRSLRRVAFAAFGQLEEANAAQLAAAPGARRVGMS